jgi:hypothetical protein
MSVKFNLVIRADFSEQVISDVEEEKLYEALAIAEHGIQAEVADMIAEAFDAGRLVADKWVNYALRSAACLME